MRVSCRLNCLKRGHPPAPVKNPVNLYAGVAVRLSNVQALFTSEMELNEASTMVQRMKALCQDAL